GLFHLFLIFCPAYPIHSVQAELPAAPDKSVVRADHYRDPVKPTVRGLEVDHRETQLPVRMAHIALSPRAHRKVLDAQQYTPIYCGASMRTEPVRMALQEADALFLDEHL